MRKTLIALSAASVLLTAPAMAQGTRDPYAGPKVAAGATVGTVVGVGHHEKWFGKRWFGGTSGIERTVGGSAALGILTGVGTVAFIDAATQPCRGFRAIFAPFIDNQPPRGCRSGEWVG